MILFDKLFDQLQNQFGKIFESSFVSFSTVGIKINIEDAIEFLNKIIDEKNALEELDSKDYLTLSICYFAYSLLERFEEKQEETEEI